MTTTSCFVCSLSLGSYTMLTNFISVQCLLSVYRPDLFFSTLSLNIENGFKLWVKLGYISDSEH